ncbi:MAG: TnsD family transposase [Alicyclobacillus macrosporangiidus]|uniref:TnsD family transposase n=1 Tax=Alicyclobacillus macrosporangiidus TaxID=392015 RepID=UPI0026F0C279|nr:TnsD family transposase [Alicyclobacillus macrosporangiidus]MCL6597493.1 TnsD family transposase [Alicyclobacillus macrosporangiidus]
MLPFLRSPYPDELLYSVFARYHIQSRNPGFKDTMEDLFGTMTPSAVFDFPNRLQSLYERLPEGTTLTPERLIEKHTLYPLFRPFLPKNRAKSIESSMMYSSVGDIHTRIGVMASSVSSPTYLRYCTQCLEEDKRRFGEPYWHRSHQVAGVFVCPHHHIWLTDSTVVTRSRRNKHELIPLSAAVSTGCTQTIKSESQASFDHYVAIAEAVYWLLNNKVPSLELSAIKEGYVGYLKAKNLATPRGSVRQRDFVNAFCNFYGSPFLEAFESFVDYNQTDNWLCKAVREPRVTTHPIRHILIMRFLGLTPEQFFASNQEYHPFGRGPWLCLNPVADHYRQPVVTRCEITRDYDTGLPVGTFHCACGFVYSRRGPDTQESDRYKIGRIKSYGTVWMDELRRLVIEEKRTYVEAASVLDAHWQTVKKYAQQLLRESSLELTTSTESDYLDVRNRYRSRWLDFMDRYPGKTKTELRRLAQAEYAWLYRYDRHWLDEHSPPPAPTKYVNKRVDWTSRDKELAERVVSAVEEIQNAKKPIRVTVSSIGKEIGELALLQRHLDKLPQTRAVIESVVETNEEFQIRRVRRIGQLLREQRKYAKEWEIIRLAGLRPGYSERVAAQIQTEIELCNRIP